MRACSIRCAGADAHRRHRLAPRPEGIAQARIGATAAQLVDLWPAMLAITCPTLLLRGARRTSCPSAHGGGDGAAATLASRCVHIAIDGARPLRA